MRSASAFLLLGEYQLECDHVNEGLLVLMDCSQMVIGGGGGGAA